MKKKKILIVTGAALLVIAAATAALAFMPVKYEKTDISAVLGVISDTEVNGKYDREAVCRYAAAAAEDPAEEIFRYFDPGKGDSATDCANFVSQCLWAGGWKMTDEWYMKKYSSSVPKPKRMFEKLKTFVRARISENTELIDENELYSTDMEYVWTNLWSCAGIQSEYGMERFFSGRFEVPEYSDLAETVLKNDIKPGDIVYQSIDNIHHVLIITGVSSDGEISFSSHNPLKYDQKIDEKTWRTFGFSGGAVIFKVRDELD